MKILRVLYIEDSERDVAVVTRHLSQADYQVTVERVETAKAMGAALQAKEWDIILCDYTMPQFNALAALALLKESKLDIPLIIISGTIGEQTAVEAMIAGAQDYLMKDNLVRLTAAVEREVQEAQNRQIRRQIEAALLESEDRYRDLVEHSLDLICTHDLEGRILSVNQTAVKLLGYNKKTLLEKNIRAILFDEIPDEFNDYIEKLLSDGIASGVMSVKTQAGKRLIWEYTNTLRSEGVAHPVMRGIAHDITERKRAEKALKESEVRQRHFTERQAAILDALPAHICLLGGDGKILDVNEPWRQYALENNFSGKNFGIESNYLDVCDRSKVIEAKQTAGGIRAVLSGESNHFGLEYPCNSPEEKKWFRLTVSPLHRDASAGVVVMHINVTERKLAEEALSQAEIKYRNLVESSPAIVYFCQSLPPYTPIYVSPNIAAFGYTPEEWFSSPDIWINLIHPEDREWVLQVTEEAMKQGLPTELEYRIIARNGQTHWLHVSGCFVSDSRGEMTGWQGLMLDITKTKELEEQLRQAQKLESVGMLAGGIAHDFNNMLTAINGYSDLTLRRMKEDDPLRRNITEIKKAGERSAALTQQLLAFSRRQVMQPVVLNINEVITDTMKILHRLIGEDIQLKTLLNPKIDRVKVDPGQFSQIIMNLAINARDAMPGGGHLTIETDNVVLESHYAETHQGVLPGAYVRLAISDTGSGMSEKTKRQIFEPFFTTKEAGKGTGLGLATVYGIVKQSGSFIEVYSEVGIGTTFKIYIPRAMEQSAETMIIEPQVEMPAGTETILLVEDEELVRNLTMEILKTSGYKVIEAESGVQALSICEKENLKFDLLMTDVVMPLMGGRELATTLKMKFPNIMILYTSGYTDDAVVRHDVIEANSNFIHKPYTPQSLTNKIRQILDNSPIAR